MFYEGNKILTMLEQKKLPLGIQCFTGSTALVEVMGATGFDFVMFDAEHSGNDARAMEEFVRTATLAGMASYIRVPDPPESAAAPADLYDAVQPWRHLICVVELAPAPEAARERFQAVFGRSDGVFLVRPDGYVGFASGEHASARQLDAYCRLWLTALAQVHTHAG